MGEIPEHLKKYQYQPGQSGNPAGRPKGACVTKRLKRIIEENEGEIADELVKTAVKQALDGNFQFWNAILDRVEGKVPEAINHAGAEGEPLKIVIERPEEGNE